ncbi:hypothetical protein [Flavobacterium sp.]|uniref:hypothetical protein n=1 Tax=Flavobacterium sp. TaxID=239 RepID=UPI0026336741|nr:hypothetical protein [Flavobacterium sp.]
MNTNDNKGREDRPQNINPDEVNVSHPAKTDKAKEKIPIKESGFGREQGQTPADEHIEPKLSEQEEQPGYNEINDVDNRDQFDSTSDWDAENSRTGRNK